MLSLFGFGKRRRKVKSSSKKSSRKPPARLLKICKKYHVKATKKVGGRRCYKSIACLKRCCLKKARAMKKKLMKMAKRSKKTTKRTTRRRTRMGEDKDIMSFGMRRRLPMFGSKDMMPESKSKFGLCYDREGNLKTLLKDSCNAPNQWKFGKRNRSVKVSKAKAMKAFRSFWKRHCAGRRSRFGNGGNPMLNASMGYEFCPNGMGGVLGANSTGLFPSPCMSSSSSGSKSMAGSLSGAMTRSTSSTAGSMTRSGSGSGAMTASAFGKRRRVRSAFGRQHMMPDGTMSAFGRRPGRPRKHRARSPTAFGRRPGRPRKYRARSTRCSMYD